MSVSSSVPRYRNVASRTRLQVVFGNGGHVLEVPRSLNKCCDQTGDYVPFDMTVEEPHTCQRDHSLDLHSQRCSFVGATLTWIVGLESQDNVSIRPHY